MKKFLITSLALAIISGCSTYSNPELKKSTVLNNKCNPIERDLTTTWENRTYWCAEPYYQQQAEILRKKLAYERAQEQRLIEQQQREAARQEKIINRQLEKEQRLIHQNTPQSEVIFSDIEISTEKNAPIALSPSAVSSTLTSQPILFFSSVSFEREKVDQFIKNNMKADSLTINSCKSVGDSINAPKERADNLKKYINNLKYSGNIKITQSCIGESAILSI